jgi:hypothetical protein
MGQFLSIEMVWNGMTIFFNDFIDAPALGDLTGSGMTWDAGSTFDFHSSDAGTIPMKVEAGNTPLIPGAAGSGTVTGINVTTVPENLIISMGPPVNLTPTSTPEPSLFALLGIGMVMVIYLTPRRRES